MKTNMIFFARILRHDISNRRKQSWQKRREDKRHTEMRELSLFINLVGEISSGQDRAMIYTSHTTVHCTVHTGASSVVASHSDSVHPRSFSSSFNTVFWDFFFFPHLQLLWVKRCFGISCFRIKVRSQPRSQGCYYDWQLGHSSP